ncbi:K+dependent Na+ exchanger related-protein [Candidatus Methanoperedens nitroreducens]|uniref:K+dependent Na+ exchanger related-protein n=1 Tax=Candidatus Methanoperedens nitratireducens TaxID=1392998 RepID=A0A062V4X5_9EURY|nr:calcium/sodium antiporter [Candidatus Methanoperedens nitroreducens]KCZ71668.1 K+dependent Na+ exchanger related-protein [Candidatus Methanoperedens nitroreducens]MDJ1421296.1 calcium/sodium antiporter [Candidatus Methanoperedens sp.]
MELLIQFSILILSLAALVFFADKLIDSSAKLAKAFGITEAVIGLTLLSYGTSLPELAVSSISSVSDHPQLSISNVIGSNIFNVALVFGLAAYIRSFTVKEAHMAGRDNYIMVVTTLLLVALIFFFGVISRTTGFIMILLLAGYTYYLLRHDRTSNQLKKDGTVSKPREIGIVIACLLVVIISGRFAVDSAVQVAKGLGVTEWLIGATIIAAGTSLPELAVSITAAKKGFFGMSVGNIVGSNIFNIMWILGFAASLSPIYMNFDMIKWDSVFLLAVTFLLAYHLVRTRVSRSDGILYLAIYLGYIIYLLFFNNLS